MTIACSTDDLCSLRATLKIVRDSNKTAYDLLPSGETIGSFANRQAVERHLRKVENKRERARESRRRKRSREAEKKNASPDDDRPRKRARQK